FAFAFAESAGADAGASRSTAASATTASPSLPHCTATASPSVTVATAPRARATRRSVLARPTTASSEPEPWSSTSSGASDTWLLIPRLGPTGASRGPLGGSMGATMPAPPDTLGPAACTADSGGGADGDAGADSGGGAGTTTGTASIMLSTWRINRSTCDQSTTAAHTLPGGIPTACSSSHSAASSAGGSDGPPHATYTARTP